jgi:hypothetical protein
MDFPWLQTAPPRAGGVDRHCTVALAELANRAGLMYRLGFTQAAATARLVARTAWEYDPPSKRPAALSDAAIAKVVADTYARRPG